MYISMLLLWYLSADGIITSVLIGCCAAEDSHEVPTSKGSGFDVSIPNTLLTQAGGVQSYKLEHPPTNVPTS